MPTLRRAPSTKHTHGIPSALQHPPGIKGCTNVLLTTNRNPFPPSSGGPKSKIKASAGPCSFRRLSGTSVLVPPGGLQAFLGLWPHHSTLGLHGHVPPNPAHRHLQSPYLSMTLTELLLSLRSPKCMPFCVALRLCAPIYQAPGMCHAQFQALRAGSDQKGHSHPFGAKGQWEQMDKNQVSSK